MKRAQCLLLSASVFFAGGLLLFRGAAAAGEEVDIIVNKANTIDDLPLTEAKKVFMGDKSTWPSGKRITIYKMPEDELGQYFVQSAFAGKISAPPKDVATAAQMKQAVAANPGAIGYVKKEDLDDSIKVVLKLQ
jgi:ABC-type phosphate transport system substrate-binding protein